MKDFYKKYLEGRCSEGEFQAFINLFLQTEKQKELEAGMAENWRESHESKDTPDLSPTLFKIHYEINKREYQNSNSRKIVTYITRIAAVLLIPLAIAFFLTMQKSTSENQMQTISTPLAAKTQFQLPDGSEVWLNSGSSISFPQTFNKKERLVSLDGEAYFDVKKNGATFRVQTSDATVDVLGTAFNVQAYQNENPSVTLERGKVLVQYKSGDQAVLNPGEQATIDPVSQKLTVTEVDTDIYSSWTRNKLVFKNESLSDVVRRLERWYNIEIQIDNNFNSDKKLTATIEYESITEVMDLLEITLSLKYEYVKNERKLIIKSKNE